jgi:hypothetical protein
MKTERFIATLLQQISGVFVFDDQLKINCSSREPAADLIEVAVAPTNVNVSQVHQILVNLWQFVW